MSEDLSIIPPPPTKTENSISQVPSGPKPAVLPQGKSSPIPNKKILPGAAAPTKSKWVLLSILIIVVVILIVALITFIKSRQPTGISSNDPRLEPTPTVIPRPTIPEQVLGTPSEYATDPQILELESAIRSLKVQMDIETFSEPELAPPTIETNIKF